MKSPFGEPIDSESSEESEMKGCFKYVMSGCLVVMVLCVVLAFFLRAAQVLVGSDESEIVTTQAEHELREMPAGISSPSESAVPPLEMIESLRADWPPELASGILRLDLEVGNFRIVAGPSGGPIGVSAEYDPANYDLAEEYSESEDGSWTYTVEFGKKKGLHLSFWGANVTSDNRLEIVVPRGAPLSIVGEVGVGESQLELGGLWIEKIDLETGVGWHVVEFLEPTQFPLETFALSSGVGRVEVLSLGAASPAGARIEQGVGQLSLDLGGKWQQNSRIRVETGVGGSEITLPRSARVELAQNRAALGDERIDWQEIERHNQALGTRAPALTLDVSSSLGGIEINFDLETPRTRRQ